MTLNEFINKYQDQYQQMYKSDRFEQALVPLLASFFERSPRTTEKWFTKTPKPVQWALTRIDREWQKTGLDFKIFFDL